MSGAASKPWRSDLNRPGSQLRALDGELAALDCARDRRSVAAPGTGPSSGFVTSDRDTGDPPDPIPVDGGLAWLAAAGAAYAARRLGTSDAEGT